MQTKVGEAQTRLLAVVLVALMVFSGLPLSVHAQAPTTPERPALALYYPWFDEGSWDSGLMVDQPAERYWSGDPNTIRRQVAEAKAAGLDGFVSAYFGPAGNNPTEANLQQLLDEGQ